MTTYTPGKWRVDHAGVVLADGNVPIAAVYPYNREGNAPLIAASPGLLEALRELVAVLAGMKADPEYFEVELKAIERAEKAIAQAQPESVRLPGGKE